MSQLFFQTQSWSSCNDGTQSWWKNTCWLHMQLRCFKLVQWESSSKREREPRPLFLVGPVSSNEIPQHPFTSKVALCWELCCYKIALAGLCETWCQGNGETTGSHCCICSGPERRTQLKAFHSPLQGICKSLIIKAPLSDRLPSAHFLYQLRNTNTTTHPLMVMTIWKMPSSTNSIRLLAKHHHASSHWCHSVLQWSTH